MHIFQLVTYYSIENLISNLNILLLIYYVYILVNSKKVQTLFILIQSTLQ